ncbi:imidazolonepropionase [Echinicola jeungdonensis]|uniref:Imidazolonepropionase n=1 Tax=Echinicola jeungdonensis TaxID=709343 RepID=A0ABV5J6C6_9BACT|nr:imidazolonepropionase [Echinicola jeungdonensis]MDN3669823.1 imidazolonepropionase [Echinicola jeungdonensis]
MLLVNIKELCGIRETPVFLKGEQMGELPTISNAYLEIDKDTIADYGPMNQLSPKKWKEKEVLDLRGQFVLPAWCDCHTHLVYVGSREGEFVDKIKGLSYREIADRGGGILNSARRIEEASEEAIFEESWIRLEEVRKMGTGAIEIKSGYGLTVEGELKMLRVIKKLKKKSKMPMRVTFLGAHAFPQEYQYDHQGYLDLICQGMIPKIAEEKLAHYVDAFCEEGFFSPDEIQQILDAAHYYGLKGKLHANQLSNSGGVQLGVKNNLLSVDHLECIGEKEIKALRNSKVIPVLLPTAAFFLQMDYPPARTMIDKGLGLVLATDYNPGSSPSGNIPFLIALSCIQMLMTPEEAINAVTNNAAFAMELEAEVGNIAKGKKANLVITKPMPSLAFLPYAFGNNMVDQVMIGGKLLY